MKENQRYFYIGYDLDNSFEFKVTKINTKGDVFIITGEDDETKIHKVPLKHFKEEMDKGKVKEIRD